MAEPPLRLVTKAAFARHINRHKSLVSKLVRPGNKLHEAVTEHGLINLELAERLLAERTDPARRRHEADELIVDGGPGIGRGGDGYAFNKARREKANADLAEIQRDEALKLLVGKKGVDSAGLDAGELFKRALVELLPELVRVARAAATMTDALEAARKTSHALLASMPARVEACIREKLGDA